MRVSREVAEADGPAEYIGGTAAPRRSVLSKPGVFPLAGCPPSPVRACKCPLQGRLARAEGGAGAPWGGPTAAAGRLRVPRPRLACWGACAERGREVAARGGRVR